MLRRGWFREIGDEVEDLYSSSQSSKQYYGYNNVIASKRI